MTYLHPKGSAFTQGPRSKLTIHLISNVDRGDCVTYKQSEAFYSLACQLLRALLLLHSIHLPSP